VTIRPIFAWYDLWVGIFIDLPKKRLYVFPLPMFGLVIEWGRKQYWVGHPVDAGPPWVLLGQTKVERDRAINDFRDGTDEEWTYYQISMTDEEYNNLPEHVGW